MTESIAEQRVRITRQIELIEHLVLCGEQGEANRARAVLSKMYGTMVRDIGRADSEPLASVQ